eukprot:364536-Chlamydomonas_euryale.AAC.19
MVLGRVCHTACLSRSPRAKLKNTCNACVAFGASSDATVFAWRVALQAHHGGAPLLPAASSCIIIASISEPPPGVPEPVSLCAHRCASHVSAAATQEQQPNQERPSEKLHQRAAVQPGVTILKTSAHMRLSQPYRHHSLGTRLLSTHAFMCPATRPASPPSQ